MDSLLTTIALLLQLRQSHLQLTSFSRYDGLNIEICEKRPNFIQISIGEQGVTDPFGFGTMKGNGF